MSSKKRRQASSVTPGWAARTSLALLFAGFMAAPAGAVTFYKWTDDRGQVHYGDTPPKAFASGAQRIDVDTTPPAATQPRPPVAPIVQPSAVPEPPAVTPDLLTQRRLTRARLEKNLEDARARLDLARKALAEAASPQEGEQQVVQGQPLPDTSGTTLFGTPNPPVVPNAGTGRANCTAIKNPTGKTVVVCPHLTPSESYYERIDRMQAEVRLAEQAVEEAELAYRRGVD